MYFVGDPKSTGSHAANNGDVVASVYGHVRDVGCRHGELRFGFATSRGWLLDYCYSGVPRACATYACLPPHVHSAADTTTSEHHGEIVDFCLHRSSLMEWHGFPF